MRSHVYAARFCAIPFCATRFCVTRCRIMPRRAAPSRRDAIQHGPTHAPPQIRRCRTPIRNTANPGPVLMPAGACQQGMAVLLRPRPPSDRVNHNHARRMVNAATALLTGSDPICGTCDIQATVRAARRINIDPVARSAASPPPSEFAVSIVARASRARAIPPTIKPPRRHCRVLFPRSRSHVKKN